MGGFSLTLLYADEAQMRPHLQPVVPISIDTTSHAGRDMRTHVDSAGLVQQSRCQQPVYWMTHAGSASDCGCQTLV